MLTANRYHNNIILKSQKIADVTLYIRTVSRVIRWNSPKTTMSDMDRVKVLNDRGIRDNVVSISENRTDLHAKAVIRGLSVETGEYFILRFGRSSRLF